MRNMTSVEDSRKRWQEIEPSQRIEVALVQVDIARNTGLCAKYSHQNMKTVYDLVRTHCRSISELRGGKLFKWDGDGGAFMFLIEDNSSFANCALAAIQMLELMPSINEEIFVSTDLETPVEIRISCDTGMVTYDEEPGNIPSDFVNKFIKHERQVSIENHIAVTERIYHQLTKHLRGRFKFWKRSPELGIDLYCAVPVQYEASPSAGNALPMQSAATCV